MLKRRIEGKCQVCRKEFKTSQLYPARLVRPSVVATIKKTIPDWNDDGEICLTDLNHYRAMHVEEVLTEEHGELSELQRMVVQSLRDHETVISQEGRELGAAATLGERLSDRMAQFGGSWKFLGVFALLLFGWIYFNSSRVAGEAYDPYPFILLNLILSCLAAVQAPIIMMSQNRQEAKDRKRATSDYQINLKAELEIRHLHEKIDHLLLRQWEHIIELQQTQIEMAAESKRT